LLLILIVKGVHAKVQELKSMEEKIASKEKEYNQLLEELYLTLYKTRDEVEEQRQIVEKLDTLTGIIVLHLVH
jgi:hypothetical protein